MSGTFGIGVAVDQSDATLYIEGPPKAEVGTPEDRSYRLTPRWDRAMLMDWTALQHHLPRVRAQAGALGGIPLLVYPVVYA
jgi:hypothetical protein